MEIVTEYDSVVHLEPSVRPWWSDICGALRDLVLFVQFKKRENTHEGALLVVKLQASSCFFTKSNTPPWVLFFTFFKLYQWYQIAQLITYVGESFLRKLLTAKSRWSIKYIWQGPRISWKLFFSQKVKARWMQTSKRIVDILTEIFANKNIDLWYTTVCWGKFKIPLQRNFAELY